LVRAGWALADSAPRSEIAALLGPLTDAKSPWRFSAGEILAYADYHAGEMQKAQAAFQALADDPAAPEGMRNRVKAMATFLKQGGLTNFGSVPPPAAPPALPGTAPAPVPPTGTPPK
ncbi:MAG TPA: hypothetical protein VGC36_16730, partial [Rhizomicrobium sp.]